MKYFKISAVLGLISLVCALLIAGFNMLTAPIIRENAIKKETEIATELFSEYDKDNSMTIELDSNTDKAITKKVLAKNSEGSELGYIYTVSGKNAYGGITLMVAIKNNKVFKVEFLENGQSFAQSVVDHVKDKYPDGSELMGKDELDSIDTKCGATYGANTVKSLVSIALNDALKGVK